MLLRAATIGLVLGCLYFMMGIARQGEPLREVQLDPPSGPAATAIIDIAGGVPRDRIASFINLAPGERVIAVGERAVASDLEAGGAIAAASPAPGDFLDLTVEGIAGPRRVLVLLH
jgi:hypothetical protein